MVQASFQMSAAKGSGWSENLASGGWRRGRVLEESFGDICGLKDSPKSLRMILSSPSSISSLQTPNQPGMNTCPGTPFVDGFPSSRTMVSASGFPNFSYSFNVERRSIASGNRSKTLPK